MLLLNLIFFSLSGVNLSRYVLNSSGKISKQSLEISSSFSKVPSENVLNLTFYSSDIYLLQCRTKNNHEYFMMVRDASFQGHWSHKAFWSVCYNMVNAWSTEALMLGFVPSYGIGRFSSLWSSDKVLFIAFIFWPLGFTTIIIWNCFYKL